MTKNLLDSILVQASSRNDKWGNEVITRTKTVIDLIAAEGRYHHKCQLGFFCTTAAGGTGRGRRKYEDKDNSFEKLHVYLKSEEKCQYTLTELSEKFAEFQEKNDETKSDRRYLENKLQLHY